MLRLIGIVVSIGLADSLNPGTVAPALFMATEGRSARDAVAQFSLVVFGVYLLGGLVIVVGPGHLLLSLVPRPDHATTQVLEVVAGAVLIVVGLLLLRYRVRLSAKQLPEVKSTGRAPWLLGLTITSFELPTAFPYFAALAAIIGSGLGLGHQLILLGLYNVCFALPLAGIVATLEFGGENAERYLVSSREYLQRHWPELLAAVALVGGAITITLGLTYTSKIVHRTIRATEHRF